MALAKTSHIFGIRDLKIAKQLTDVTGSAPTYDAFIDIPGIKSLGMDKQITSKEAKGDEKTTDTEDILEYINVTWENMELPLEACAIIEGSALSTTGTGETEVNQLMETSNDKQNYFKIQALAKRGSDGVNDVGVELFKVKGTLTYSFKGEDFATCSFKGRAIACKGTIDTHENPIRRLTYASGVITIQ